MISLKKINKGKGNREISVMFEDEPLKIVYNRQKYTPKLERELQEKMNSGLPGSMLAEFLGSLILDWNAMDVAEKDVLVADALEEKLGRLPTVAELEEAGCEMVKVPLEEETFDALLSVEAQSSIVEALADDQRPNQKPSGFTEST